jgi:hypothetical protein
MVRSLSLRFDSMPKETSAPSRRIAYSTMVLRYLSPLLNPHTGMVTHTWYVTMYVYPMLLLKYCCTCFLTVFGLFRLPEVESSRPLLL